MVTDPQKLLAMYDSGRITEGELIIRLVQAAAGSVPPAEIAAAVPVTTLDLIREKAHTPRDTKLRVIFGGTFAGTPEQWEAARDREERIWREGLDRWREYFGFTG